MKKVKVRAVYRILDIIKLDHAKDLYIYIYISIALQFRLASSQFRYYVDVLFREVCVLVFEMVIVFSH